MKHHRLWTPALIVGIAVGSSCASPAPKDHGESASLIASLKDQDPRARRYAAYALGQSSPAPTEAIRPLIQLLKDSDPTVRVSAVYTLGRLGPEAREAVQDLVSLIGDGESEVRDQAVIALGSIGPAAASAIPTLHRAAREGDYWLAEEASSALGKIGAASVPALIGLLTHEDVKVRLNAMVALKAIGPAAHDAAPAMVKAIRDPLLNHQIYPGTWYYLTGLGETVVPFLIEEFRSEDPDRRAAALGAIWEMGPTAKAAAPVLFEALKRDELSVREDEIRALARMGTAAIPILTQALKDPVAPMRIGAAETFFQMVLEKVEIPDAAAHALFAALGDEEAEVRNWASGTLGRMGASALPSLREALYQGNPLVRESAARAIGDLRAEAGIAVPDLIRAFQDDNEAVSSSAAQALAFVGPAAKEAVPALVAGLKSASLERRQSAAFVVCQLGPAARSATPNLIAALRDKDSMVRARAAEALGAIGPGEDKVVPALVPALSDEEEYVRGSAATALGRLGAASRPAVPALLRALHDPEPSVRGDAAKALGNLGPATEEVSAALRRALQDPHGHVWSNAATALLELNSGVPQVLPILFRAIKNPDREISNTAKVALDKLGPKATGAGVSLCIAELESTDRIASESAQAGLIGIGAPAVPALIGRLNQANEVVQDSIMVILWRIGPEVDGVLEAIAHCLETGSGYKLNRAAQILQEWGRPGVPVLIRALAHRSPEVRSLAANSMPISGPDVRVDLLVRALEDEEPYVRSSAASTLGLIGPPAKDAIPFLIRQLEEPGIRENVQIALDRVRGID